MTTEVDNYPNLEKIFYDTIEWSISNILSNKIIYILLSILLIDHCILPLKMFLSLGKLLTWAIVINENDSQISKSKNKKNPPCIKSCAMKPNFLKLVFLASSTNQTCEIGDNNDSGLPERRDHEGDVLSKRRSSRVKKRTINYADDEDKSDPEDSETEYDKVVVLGSQIASKIKKKKDDFQKEWKYNRHKNKSKSQEVIDTTVANNNSLSVNNAIDGLSSSTNWLGTDIYIAPPHDVNCSDEDSADDDNPHLRNLSGKQLMANCERQVTGYDDNNDVNSWYRWACCNWWRWALMS